jgi:hypothetical protein
MDTSPRKLEEGKGRDHELDKEYVRAKATLLAADASLREKR